MCDDPRLEVKCLKRFLLFFLALVFFFPSAARGEKEKTLPAAFTVKYETVERMENGKKTFISKDRISTLRADVDEEINALADAFDRQLSPLLQPDESGNPRRNSRLDIHIVHSLSGDSCVSFLILARESYRRVQKQSPFETRTYDMATGQLITLSDLFPQDSEAWDVIAETVFEELYSYYPKETPDEKTLLSLCTLEAIRETPFTLGPVSLTLHYEAKTLYPSHPCLMRVTIPYTALRGMMTDFGARQTDNSKYKMVALTFDDGPAYSTTATLLNYLRQAGAQATFFLVGERIPEYADIVMRENDENHSLQSHHYKHSDTSKSTPARIQAYTQRFYDTLTQTVGTAPWVLRPPYGISDPFIQARVNLPLIEWDVDTKDWTSKSASAVLSVVKNETKDGSIILMHDIKENTPDSAKQVMSWLKSNGFLCVTIEELFIQNGQPFLPNRVYFSISKNPEAEE